MVDQQNAVCEVCGAAFTGADLLRDHATMHDLRCPTCSAEFTTEALLADHERMHTEGGTSEDGALLEKQGERKP